MRRLSISNKKVRGVPRKLRWLADWSENFKGYFPDDIPLSERYWNWKIPVTANMVQGKHAKRDVKAQCAQRLINACKYLIDAKPQTDNFVRVTCVVVLPDMFTSEVCLYLDEDYLHAHTASGIHDKPENLVPAGRSLAAEWGLLLPAGVSERGVRVEYHDPDEPENSYSGEHWYFGEVN